MPYVDKTDKNWNVKQSIQLMSLTSWKLISPMNIGEYGLTRFKLGIKKEPRSICMTMCARQFFFFFTGTIVKAPGSVRCG